MFNKLKQINELRDKAKQLQDMLSTFSAQGSAGWGKVKVTVNGVQQIMAVEIDEAAMSDRVKLQETIKDACNDAMQKIQKEVALKMKDMGGLDLAKDLQKAMGQDGGESLMSE